jgi:HAD superfamily hydrolase (TIGR01509 family)
MLLLRHKWQSAQGIMTALMIHGLIFDLGSTLLHNPHDNHWAAALNRMRGDLVVYLQGAGYALDDPEPFLALFAAKVADYSDQRQSDWVEYSTTWILTSTLAELNLPAPPPALLRDALAAYYAYSESLWQPVDGLHATLQALAGAGLRLGLISNAADDGNVQRLIDNADLRRYFDPILVSAALGLRKPNPAIFQRLLLAWGLPAAECVMVGDTLGADILGAQLAGLHNVWYTPYADHPANRAHRGNILPEAEIERLDQLPALLARWD